MMFCVTKQTNCTNKTIQPNTTAEKREKKKKQTNCNETSEEVIIVKLDINEDVADDNDEKKCPHTPHTHTHTNKTKLLLNSFNLVRI